MSEKSRCVVAGYSSVDLKFATEPFAGLGQTTIVREPLTDCEPQPGAVAYFARALRRNAVEVDLVSWLGEDDKGRMVLQELSRLGVDVSALSLRGTRSPTTYMFYGPTGTVASYYDPGDLDLSVTLKQREVLATADAVLIGIGPHPATLELLKCIPDTALVMWAVKADPASLPEELATALVERADIVSLSESEEDFFTRACGAGLAELSRRGVLVVRTEGANGVGCLIDGEEAHRGTVEPVAVTDATGAGDTFAAGLLARLIGRSPRTGEDVQNALDGACADAHELLRDRQKEAR